MDSFNNDYLIEGGNRSFNSTFTSPSFSASSVNTASSSKAVLAALKALQDKIRRLETERSQALDEISHLKLQLKNQEIEFENMKQRETLANQKLIQESKLSYERLLQDKADLELKLQSIIEKNQSMNEISNNLSLKIQIIEDEKKSLIDKVKELEHENRQIDVQIKSSQYHEKG